MRTIRSLIMGLAFAACARGTSSEALKMDASNEEIDAPTSHGDSALPIDAPAAIDAAVPIDVPAPPVDASDIGNDCFLNSQCPDQGTCCFFGTCKEGIAGANNTCIPI
jgi:hypothetical protein